MIVATALREKKTMQFCLAILLALCFSLIYVYYQLDFIQLTDYCYVTKIKRGWDVLLLCTIILLLRHKELSKFDASNDTQYAEMTVTLWHFSVRNIITENSAFALWTSAFGSSYLLPVHQL